MKQIGLKDENFGDLGDFTGDVLVPLDFNTVAPILKKKPVEIFTIGAETFEELLSLLKKELGEEKRNHDALILMRIKESQASTKKAAEYGHVIAEQFFEESIVTWSAQSYHMFRFDFYIYLSDEEENELAHLNSKGHSDITIKCANCGKKLEMVIPTVIKEEGLEGQTFLCEKCGEHLEPIKK